jgi:hypothetical protein
LGKIGKRTIEDTGALTKKRMETIDDETGSGLRLEKSVNRVHFTRGSQCPHLTRELMFDLKSLCVGKSGAMEIEHSSIAPIMLSKGDCHST